jgi:hypothetical protein
MASTVKTRPNHYETLGLSPGASSEEIAQAFAREISMSRPRAFGGIAEVSIAYATLSDPAKRKAYDVSIGLSAPAKLVEPPKYAAFPAFHAEPRPRARPAAEPRMASFIAASLREPVEASPRHDAPPVAAPAPAPAPRPAPVVQPAETRAKPSPEPQAVRNRVHVRLEEEPGREAEHQPIEWKRPAAAAGALLGGVALLGAWAGWDAGNAVEAQQPQRAVTLALPQAKPPAATIAPAPAPLPNVAEVQPQRRTRLAVADTPVARAPVAQQSAQADPLAPIEPNTAEATPAEQTTAEAPAAAVAASLPLPNAVIARTIGSIGYSCGRVASTAAMEAPGVFKVTCTSGQSYRAAPVGGRYHFRRLGSH